MALVDGRGPCVVSVRPRRAVHRLVFAGEAEVACRARMLSVVSDSLPEHFFPNYRAENSCELRGGEWEVRAFVVPEENHVDGPKSMRIYAKYRNIAHL